VFLPKFKFEYGTSLVEVLAAMGMEEAFIAGIADFTNINPAGGLYISDVLHKTFVEVNEEGTEAAAVTVVVMNDSSVSDEIFFTANKPFVFIIREESTNSILFMGKIAEPVYED